MLRNPPAATNSLNVIGGGHFLHGHAAALFRSQGTKVPWRHITGRGTSVLDGAPQQINTSQDIGSLVHVSSPVSAIDLFDDCTSSCSEEVFENIYRYNFSAPLAIAYSRLCIQAGRQGLEVLTPRLILETTIAEIICHACRDQDGTGSNNGGTTADASYLTVPQATGSAPQGKKRSRQGEKGQPPNRGKRPRSSRASTDQPFDALKPKFACPFFLQNKDEHRDCLRLRLTRIGDVRQHISRKHLQQPHCPTCGAVFDEDTTTTLLTGHIAQANCSRPEGGFYLPGATMDQWDSICKAAENKVPRTAWDRWFEIWDILFPLEEHPPSPYSFPALVQELRMYIDQYLSSNNADRPLSIIRDSDADHRPMDLILTLLTDFNNFVGDREADLQGYTAIGGGNAEPNLNQARPPPSPPATSFPGPRSDTNDSFGLPTSNSGSVPYWSQPPPAIVYNNGADRGSFAASAPNPAEQHAFSPAGASSPPPNIERNLYEFIGGPDDEQHQGAHPSPWANPMWDFNNGDENA